MTIAVLLVRSGLGGAGSTTTTTQSTSTHPASTTPKAREKHKASKSAARFYSVVSGDTFGSISAKTGVSISRIEQLNPGVSSNSLHVGQKLRVK